jgi:hypothetical protein
VRAWVGGRGGGWWTARIRHSMVFSSLFPHTLRATAVMTTWEDQDINDDLLQAGRSDSRSSAGRGSTLSPRVLRWPGRSRGVRATVTHGAGEHTSSANLILRLVRSFPRSPLRMNADVGLSRLPGRAGGTRGIYAASKSVCDEEPRRARRRGSTSRGVDGVDGSKLSGKTRQGA